MAMEMQPKQQKKAAPAPKSSKLRTNVAKWLKANPIRQFREELGLSVDGFAAWLGVAPSRVRRWENGFAMPSEQVLALLTEHGYEEDAWERWFEGRPSLLSDGS